MNAPNVQAERPAQQRDAFACPNCPRCASVVHVAERSVFNLPGRIWHAWACDRCGEEFATSISVLPLQV